MGAGRKTDASVSIDQRVVDPHRFSECMFFLINIQHNNANTALALLNHTIEQPRGSDAQSQENT